MSGQVDPWDAMVQNDDSDEDYIPTGADGIDDEDQDFEQDDDHHQDVDEDDTSDDNELQNIGNSALGRCMLCFSYVTSPEWETDRFAQT